MAEPLWPECSRCRRTARPGVECTRTICPFVRTQLLDGEWVIGRPGMVSEVLVPEVRGDEQE